MLLLDNQWTGAVIQAQPEASTWNSRLDFSQRSPKTGFLFDDPPPGSLYQTPTALEFRTLPSAIVRKPKVYQNMYVRVERSAQDAQSPSLNYGRKIYPGKIRYYFADYNQEPVAGISTALMDVTRFVDDISSAGALLDPSDSYNFIDALLAAFKAHPL